MDIKPHPNHDLCLKALQRMTPEERLKKVFELSAMTKALFLHGLRRRFPAKSEKEIRNLYLERIAKCHNRNY
jgi:hypothetical protein